jgi:hypothetical protein
MSLLTDLQTKRERAQKQVDSLMDYIKGLDIVIQQEMKELGSAGSAGSISSKAKIPASARPARENKGPINHKMRALITQGLQNGRRMRPRMLIEVINESRPEAEKIKDHSVHNELSNMFRDKIVDKELGEYFLKSQT